MPRAARLLSLALAAVAALALGGCGNKKEVRTEAATEGPYITLNQLKYQIQISRILNPADVEDSAYLKGVSTGVAPKADEVWFAIFMRVQNTTGKPLKPADTFEMRDTTGGNYTALNLDAKANVFAYKPNPIEPGGLIPTPNSPPSDNTIQGSLLLFKVKTGALYNRPVQLRISSSTGGGPTGVIDLDI
jgi:hypothetical protein